MSFDSIYKGLDTVISNGPYDVVVIDPPWKYYAPRNTLSPAENQYKCLSDDDIALFPVNKLIHRGKSNSAVLLWATCPKLKSAINILERWELEYRGVAFVWVKTDRNGKVMFGCGPTPTFVKPTTELLLLASTNKKGRPLPIRRLNTPQVVLHRRLEHSQKPDKFYELIESTVLESAKKCDIFSRKTRDGWQCWGDEVTSER